MKLVVPVLVMVPVLVNVPAIFNVPATVVVNVAPLLMVKLLQATLLPIMGILVAVEKITTLVVAVGTVPVHQLPASLQLVLTFPDHKPAALMVMAAALDSFVAIYGLGETLFTLLSTAFLYT